MKLSLAKTSALALIAAGVGQSAKAVPSFVWDKTSGQNCYVLYERKHRQNITIYSSNYCNYNKELSSPDVQKCDYCHLSWLVVWHMPHA